MESLQLINTICNVTISTTQRFHRGVCHTRKNAYDCPVWTEEKLLASQTRQDDETRSSAGRPRKSEIDDRIIAAARSLLANGGYEALSFEAIGKQTGIGRPTIYRRWPSKAHLAAAIAYGKDRPLPKTDGDLRSQVEALVRQVEQQYSHPDIASAAIGLINAFYNDEALRNELHTPAENSARKQLQAIVADGKARGTIIADADADVLFDMIVGTLVFRIMFSSTERPEDHAGKLIDHLCRALAPETDGA